MTWLKPITTISKFPYLSSIQFRFNFPGYSECWICEENHGDWNSQFQLLKLLFGALCIRDRPMASFRRLSIMNHPDFYDAQFEYSSKFKQTLSRLKELQIVITRMEKKRDTLHSFLEDFPSLWLRPSLEHLTHLTIYYDDYWGWDPAVNLRDIQFPKLIYLAMKNYTFAHDWQIKWITAHGSTLKTLLLEKCPILICMVRAWYEPTVNHDDHEIFLYREFQVDGQLHDENHWTYKRRWYHFYAMLEAGLPFLTKFGCWHEHGSEWAQELYDVEFFFEARDSMLPQLPQDRYIVHNGPKLPRVDADNGSLSRYRSPWSYADPESTSMHRRYRVTSPAIAEPPYRLHSKAARVWWAEIRRSRGDSSDEDESEEDESDEEENLEDGKDAIWDQMCDFNFLAGCQKDDERAFSSFIRAVTGRARAQGH